ncbi:flagellar protein FlaG [Gottschalkia acidurici 9a]|uniref:Flagellar protein FlaG n=1 Tax=Gottschalkia acidurici (strain ATCC 7906 / DSM 604 / BCRC 14475 / CIP 104303 / KCTC 5404 / NCIMB 10678 / 9a) TaxID=1128398 RepID=K0AX63_GOTA9|nr:flagellar protein FlaG [Gottschalkia acidurici]AFS77335.1 flagellar protein FlaG [Gottschalkia acidurici 9a]
MNISNSVTYEQSQHSVGDISVIADSTDKEIDLQLRDSIERNKEKDINIEQIESILNKSNKQMLMYDRRLDISIHEKTKQIMVKVIDVNTDEVIREIPPEKVLDIVAKRKETLGLLMDKKI